VARSKQAQVCPVSFLPFATGATQALGSGRRLQPPGNRTKTLPALRVACDRGFMGVIAERSAMAETPDTPGPQASEVIPPLQNLDAHDRKIRNAAIEEAAQVVEQWFAGESWFTNKHKAGLEIVAAIRALKSA
jgi:hypothetical protein